MGNKLSFIKTILVPALISLAFYLLLTYVILPIIRHHRQRYAHYLPIATPITASLHSRFQTFVATLILPSTWGFMPYRRNSTGRSGFSNNHDEDNESLFDDEEGEGLVGFEIDARRREALERRRSSGGADDGVVRLSRDLEEGFRDDSSDEEGESLPVVAGSGREGRP